MASAAVLVAGGIVVGMGGAFAATNSSSDSSSSDQSSSATPTSKKSNNKGKTKQAKKKDDNNNGQDDQGDKQDPDKAQPPKANDFIDINKVKPNRQQQQNAGKNGSAGTFTTECGNKANHQNSDNVIAAPGVQDGAQHTHDYVGNDSTDANSDDDSLAAAGTSCKNQDDKSTYFWPVIRDLNKDGNDANKQGGGKDGNFGQILEPQSAKLQFVGNAKSQVTAMPQGLRILDGNAKAVSQNGDNAKKTWTCTGFEDRLTDKYPICPQGSQVERIHEFPNCWDGQNTDSDDHRSHIVDANNDGSCPKGFQAVPQLQVTLTYNVPQNNNFAVDGFPEELHKPQTDHDDFINVMSDNLMNQVVDCINNGQNCVNQGQ
jgi:hypothetical protein